MYALVEIAGQQFRAEVNSTIKTQKLPAQAGDKVSFNRVLLVGDGENVRTGAPTLESASIEGTIVEHTRDRKVIVFKKKKRKGYRKTNGHRQPRTVVRIDAIHA